MLRPRNYRLAALHLRRHLQQYRQIVQTNYLSYLSLNRLIVPFLFPDEMIERHDFNAKRVVNTDADLSSIAQV